MTTATIVIGIGSGSGGGKTRITDELVSTLPNATAVHFDEFDDTTEHPSDMRTWLQSGADFNAWITPVLLEHLHQLKQDDSDELADNRVQFIVFDAPLGRAHVETGQLIDLMVFLDTPLDIAMARRLLRDGFHENPESHLRGYLEWSRGLFLEHARQLAATSDLILDGAEDPEFLVKSIIDEIERKYDFRIDRRDGTEEPKR